MKVVMLVPCLMLENNRAANYRAMDYAKEHYGVDEIIVNASCFLPEDYRDGFTYIGHADKREGFAVARNRLLEYFYQSDADYAIWMDANKRVSKSTLNDFCTIVEALKSGELDIDGIFSTLGIICSQERILAKKLPDYFNTVKLVNFKGGYDWMHAMVMKNIKKYYNVELYCDLACNNLDFSGTIPEDIYFTRLFRKLFDCRLAPTVTVSTPSNKTSTWVSNKVGYDYPKPDGKLIDKLVSQCIVRDNLKQFNRTEKTLTLPRIDKYKDLVKGYSPKSKAVKTNLLRGTDGKI